MNGLVFGLYIGLFVDPIYGLSVGLLSGLVTARLKSLQAVAPADTLAWSWEEARTGLGLSLIIALGIGLVFGLAVGLVVWLFSGLIEGLVTHSVRERSAVHGGLKRSAAYAFRFALAGIGAAAVLLVAAPGLGFSNEFSLAMAFPICWSAGIISIDKGGAFCVKYLRLRWMLARAKYTPWRYVTFLNFGAERVLLIRQGGSFRFIHRMLQEHLAAQAESSRG